MGEVLAGLLVVGIVCSSLNVPVQAEILPGQLTPVSLSDYAAPQQQPPGSEVIAQQGSSLPAAIPGTQSKITGITRQALRLSPQPHHTLMRTMLLVMAYEQDPELLKMIKKQGYANPAILAVVLGVYGLTLAEGIYIADGAYTRPAVGGYHAIKNRQAVTGNITTIIGGLGLGSTLAIVAWIAHYNKKISKRKQVIRNQVDAILTQLSAGAGDQQVHAPLLALLKDEESVAEFLSLWRSAHQKSTSADVPDAPRPDGQLSPETGH